MMKEYLRFDQLRDVTCQKKGVTEKRGFEVNSGSAVARSVTRREKRELTGITIVINKMRPFISHTIKKRY